MGCDCKANRAIFELGKRYGNTVGRTRKDAVKSGLWKAVQYLFLGLFSIVAAPVILLVIVYKTNVKKEKVIHIDKLVGLNR